MKSFVCGMSIWSKILHHDKSGRGWGRWFRQKTVTRYETVGVRVKPVEMEGRGKSDSHFGLSTGHGEGRC